MGARTAWVAAAALAAAGWANAFWPEPALRWPVAAEDAAAFADVNLAGEVAVVLILVAGEAPLEAPGAELLGQGGVGLGEVEEAERVVAEALGEAVAPGVGVRLPGCEQVVDGLRELGFGVAEAAHGVGSGRVAAGAGPAGRR